MFNPIRIRFGKFSKELWLEYGYIKSSFKDTVWHNDGEVKEFWYWFKKLFSFRSDKTKVYFIFKYKFVEISIFLQRHTR